MLLRCEIEIRISFRGGPFKLLRESEERSTPARCFLYLCLPGVCVLICRPRWGSGGVQKPCWLWNQIWICVLTCRSAA